MPRFRNTWKRRRHDLKDQSQSGYDMALADFGVEAGLPEQQIVDLIVHHRTIHGQKQRTKLDYFQRTIARAFERNPQAPAGQHSASAPAAAAASTPVVASQPDDASGPTQEDPPPAMSPERVKADLCAKISTVIGIPVPVTRLVRITGKDPSYRMELGDGAMLEFTTINKFADQDAVRWAVATQTKWIMPQVKPSRWREIAQDMLHACFDEQGPIEAQWADAARDTVARYLDDNGFIDDIATAHPQYRGKPVVILGRIAINTTDLRAWINKTTVQALSVKALASMLSAMSAVQMTVPVKRRDQSRWLLPIEHFDPADYDKTAPKTTEATEATEVTRAIQ